MAQYGIGLSALNAFSEAIDVTSNNIANGQTVGYKSAEYVFADQFFKAQNPQSRDRAGMGTSRMIIRRANTYGTITGTQNPLDLAIAGPGMFVLAKQTTGANVPTEEPQKFQYTRNGQFAVDAQNRIVNENGLFLVGYAADEATGTILADKTVLKFDTKKLEQVATRSSTLEVNLDNRRESLGGRKFDRLDPASYSQSTSQTVYDDKGKSHTLSLFYKKVNSADLTLKDTGGTGTTFQFEVMQSLGTTLNGEQTNKIATNAVAHGSGSDGSTQTLNYVQSTYLSGGLEQSNGLKTLDKSTVVASGTLIDGIYKNVALKGDTSDAEGAIATITVLGGEITKLEITKTGYGYSESETVSGSFGNNWDFTVGVDSLVQNIPSISKTEGTSGRTESAAVTFKALKAGDTVTLGGRTFTAGASGATAEQVATDFAAASNTYGTTSGTLSGWTLSRSGSTVTFTSTTPTTNISPNLSETVTSGSAPVISPYVQGVNTSATESGLVTFKDLKAGDIITVGGRTYTALTNVSASDVASDFAGGTTTARGTIGGGLISGWTISAGTGATSRTFTYTANTAVTDLTATATSGSASTIVTTEGIAKNTETALVTFEGLKAGQKLTIAGLTFTAGSSGASADQVAAAFAGLNSGDDGSTSTTSVGTFSGVLNGWNAGSNTSGVVEFTSTTEDINVNDLYASVTGDGLLGSVYNLKLNDGTQLTAKRSSLGDQEDTYQVEVDRYAVFATLDTIPVGSDPNDPGTTSIALSGLPVGEQTSIGTMAFIAGKNLDSLSRDALGDPQYITQFNITASRGTGNGWSQTTNGGKVEFKLYSTDTTGYTTSEQTYTNSQDGSPASELTGYSFDSYGRLVAQYDNGKSVIKGQLVLATFNNFEGLIPVGGNAFQASAASGDPKEDKPNGSQMGAIRSQAIEESNVDLTQQLVKLMVLQRAYSAASQATKVQVATLVDDTLRIGQ